MGRQNAQKSKENNEKRKKKLLEMMKINKKKYFIQITIDEKKLSYYHIART